MNNNIFEEMLIQQDPDMFGSLVNQTQGQPISPANVVMAEALGRGAAATPAVTPAVAPAAKESTGADTLAKFKLQNQQRDAAARQKAIDPGNTAGFGRYAPLAGALKGIAAQYVRGQDDIKLEEAMQGYEQEQQRVYEQKLAQARLAREQELQDAQRTHENTIAAEQAKQVAIAENRAPMTPEQELALAQARILLGNQIRESEKSEAAEEVAVYEAASRKEGAEDRVVDGINIIDGLLNAEPEVGPTSAFPPLGILDALAGSRTPLEQASGWESNLFTLNGSPAANAESALQRLRGMNFLDVIEEMKGSGTITEVEGQKGEAAMAALEESQSDDVIKQSLLDLQGILKKNLEISRSAPGPRLSEKPIRTATHPETGEKIGLFRDGQWRPIK